MARKYNKKSVASLNQIFIENLKKYDHSIITIPWVELKKRIFLAYFLFIDIAWIFVVVAVVVDVRLRF